MNLRSLWFRDKKIDEKTRREAIQGAFRRTARTEDGLVCLSLILEGLWAFREADTAETKTLKNYATFIIREYLGATDPVALTESLVKVGEING